MLAITIPSYSPPAGYEISEVSKPEVSHPKDVLIRVHAGSINPIDVKKASGVLRMALKDSFPYKIGYDCAGTVVQTGPDVVRCNVGDAVYTRLPEFARGAWSEYVKCPEDYVSLKPTSVSFEEAAAIPLAAMTAFQALGKYEGDLKGKTVFVPGGLSGTGTYACQLAKHFFQAGKVITTVSTAKVPLVKELLGDGTVDEIIDYTTADPKTIIPGGSVDFFFDTMGQAMEYLCLMRSKTGTIISISTAPSGDLLQNSGVMRQGPDGTVATVPAIVRIALNLADSLRRMRAWRYGVRYEYMFLEPTGKDLDVLRESVDSGKLKPVVGTIAEFKDIETCRKACQVVYDGKGGIGKAVIKFDVN